MQRNLARLEALKPRINKRYERYTQLARDREARKASSQARESAGQTSNTSLRHPSSDYALVGNKQHLEAGENKELAVKLAQKEISRRATARKATRQAGISQEEERRRRIAGDWGNWDKPLTDRSGRGDDDLSQRLQAVRARVEPRRVQDAQNRESLPSLGYAKEEGRSSSSYKYPSVPVKSNYKAYTAPERPPKALYDPAPALPPKGPILSQDRQESSLPPLPDKISLSNGRPTTPPADLQPSTFTFKPSAYLENGTPLRTVFLPPTLRSTFLSIARPNTRANLETCGILCGTLISNALFVSRLVIPDQESTSDTCETKDEGALFDYCDSEDLLMLGWIHTHPTQTCFMSSRDLHTHFAYQVMMPESIALVCAPSKREPDDWGVFRLTDPPGMGVIRDCRQTGLFHPHESDHVYTGALRPGHVMEAKGLEFGVVDLRPGY